MKLTPLNVHNTKNLSKINSADEQKNIFTKANPVNLDNQIQKQKTIADPSGIVNDSVFSLIRAFKIKNFLFFLFGLSIFLSAVGLALADYFIVKTDWFAFILPAVIGLVGLYLSINALIDKGALKRDVAKYRVDLQQGLTSTPPFLSRSYWKLNVRQIAHNWWTFYIFFFGIIFLLCVYFLQDKNFWVFDFESWIKNAFVNVQLVEIIGFTLLALNIVTHFLMAIFRKRRIYQLESYFGTQLIDAATLSEEKRKINKMYWRIFVFIILLILVIPLLTVLILKLRKK